MDIGSHVEVADKRPADEAICVRETKGTFFLVLTKAVSANP